MRERRDAIVKMVSAEGTVTFQQIKAAFPEVSEMTLRTDLKALDQERRLVRIHGGARSVEQVVGTDGLLDVRARKNVEAKRIIASKALELVRPGSTVCLDSGSTAAALASMLPDEPLMVFTTGLTCALELARLTQVRVHLPGGRFNRYSSSLSGASCIEAVNRLTFDQFFMGISGYAEDTGFACGSDEDAGVKRACMDRAGQVVVLMDSSKVGSRSTFRVCDLANVDVVVGDDHLPEPLRHACAEAGVKVL